ncbi:MAG: hypothetical protein OEV59_03500 [Deltaproteobacteria bacterium]|nr:hypothetical protein [Deltaproteobacteria bacterium]
MTFIEFLKKKKDIDPDTRDLDELMDEYYEEYKAFMTGLKDGCGDN